jgi:hypothetical protein
LAAEAFKAAQAADAAAAAALGPDTPPWAAALVARMGALGEQMRADSAQVNAGLAQTNAAVVQMGARMRAQFTQLHARFDHVDARMANRLALLNDPLTPLRAPGGDVPPDFPASRGDLHRLTGPQLAALLSAYCVVVPPDVEARRRAFALFIGVPV